MSAVVTRYLAEDDGTPLVRLEIPEAEVDERMLRIEAHAALMTWAFREMRRQGAEPRGGAIVRTVKGVLTVVVGDGRPDGIAP